MVWPHRCSVRDDSRCAVAGAVPAGRRIFSAVHHEGQYLAALAGGLIPSSPSLHNTLPPLFYRSFPGRFT